MSGGVEFRRVLFRSSAKQAYPAQRSLFQTNFFIKNSATPSASFRSKRGVRSEERRVGKEGRCRGEWSSDVCSSDLLQSKPIQRNDLFFRQTSLLKTPPRLRRHSDQSGG